VTERPVTAVVFDWGGVLTPWHTIDLREQWFAYARAYDPGRSDELAALLLEAEEACWRAGRTHQRSSTLDEVFRGVGIDPVGPRHDAALVAYHAFWEPHTHAAPGARDTMQGVRDRGLLVGVLSNTLWTRAHHELVFARDGLLPLIDGAVYSSEIPFTKPHPEAFRAAMTTIGVNDPGAVVFVGDRPFEDIHGSKSVGMRAVLVPHSEIPADQRGHVEGEPDAVISELPELLPLVDAWNTA
jgi:putative hydrolase of the HAD superfamily